MKYITLYQQRQPLLLQREPSFPLVPSLAIFNLQPLIKILGHAFQLHLQKRGRAPLKTRNRHL